MRLADLAGRRVALLGAGADVRAALDHVRAVAPASVIVATDHPDHDRIDGLETHDLATGAPAGVDVFVRSPGFGRHQAWLVRAVEAGASVTTPLDLWLGTHGAARDVATVTGTKGKSSVTTFCAVLGGGVEPPVSVAGNLGPPVFSAGWDRGGAVVLEVSSYQAADLHHVGRIGVLTSLAQDHISWHGGLERYVLDKLRCFANEGGRVAELLVPAGEEPALAAVRSQGHDPVVVEVPAPWRQRWPDAPDHTLANLALAAEVVERLGGTRPDDDALDAALTAGVEGRLEVIGRVGDVTVVDDPLASNPFAAAAGLAWVRHRSAAASQGSGRCVVLLGGEDRGVSVGPLEDEARRWTGATLAAVALPDTGTMLAGAAGIPLVATAVTLDEALAAALDHLGADGGTVLFAPGAPTPGRRTWKDRSAELRAAVAERTSGADLP